MSRKLRPETYNESVCAADRFKTSCLPFVDTLLTWAKSAEEGRERERKKNQTARGGRITKIVHCIRIAFGLLYNYKPDLSLNMILKPFEPSRTVSARYVA